MDIVTRLKQLAHAVADEDWSEFSMRVPADSERDADLVLLRASKEIESLRAELAECKRDAERYRWIIRNMHLSIAQNGAWWSLTDASQVAPNHISEVGSTIDAALAAKGE